MQDAKYPEWLDRNEYPFKSNFFQTPVGKMHYVDEGNGEPIVFVHGNPGWSFEFRNVIKEMSKTNRCIACDHIGFGLSEKPWEYDYLPVNQAKNFEQLMNHLDLNNITLVFNDWGGPIALAYAIKNPERIKKLLIMNTYLWSVEDDRYYRAFSSMMGGPVGRFLIKNFNIFGGFFLTKVVADKKSLPKHIHKHYYEHLATRRERKGCYTFPYQIVHSGKWLNELWEQREKINSIPTTFLWGMKDIAFREKELNYWLANWNNPQVIKLANVGHYPQEEAPQEVIRVLKEQK